MIKTIQLVIVTLSFIFSAGLALADSPLTVTTSAETAPGVLFMATGGHLYIFDNQGQVVFTREVNPNAGTDFRVHPNGLLSYFDGQADQFVILDSNYIVTGTIQAGNGYASETDTHDLLFLPNGNRALLIYHRFTYDVTPIEPTGHATATIVTTIIQEQDETGNVVFQWDTWDYLPLTHTNRSLTGTMIDYAHGNALELDTDGNYLLSSRHLDEITKVDRTTGEVIWRLGGKGNEFIFTNDAGFGLQHDIRRLPNGHITLFDNGPEERGYSRAVEYEIDEVNKVITKTWEYQNLDGVYSRCCGSVKRLPNGNTLIGWGRGQPAVTEVTPGGTVVFEASFNAPNAFSYRVYRLPFPAWRFWMPIVRN